MFAVLTLLLPKIFVANFHWLIQALLSGAGGVGIYKLAAKGIEFVMGRSLWVKKILLGAYFVEGTWVGYFIGRNKDKRYVVETFEQDLEGLTIRGRSFSEDGELHAQWLSEASALDIERGRLMYTYSCDILSRKITLHGVGVFQFERTSKRNAPTAIHGFVSDLIDGKRLEANEIKISSCLMTTMEGFSIAKEKFAG
jgi:hypothetical protein